MLIESLNPVVVKEIHTEMSRVPLNPVDCWFCCGLIVKGTSLLVVPYYPDYQNDPERVQLKFPGGCGEGAHNTPEQTLRAEILQEVLDPSVLDPEDQITDWTALHRKVIPCREHPGGNHTKYAARVKIADEGMIRTGDFYEGRDLTEDGTETNEMLGPPLFVPADDLVTEGRSLSLFRGHKPFLLALARTKLPEGETWYYVANQLTNMQNISI